jgi:hypothetical protein
VDVGDPARLLIPAGTAAVLRVLVSADTSFTMREVGRLAEVSPPVARDVLLRLAKHGLVVTTTAGSATLCRYNGEHLAADVVRQLVSLRAAMLDLLRDAVASWTIRPRHASLYGSAARGDGDVSSDLDVLVVRPDGIDDDAWEEQQNETGRTVQSRTGNDVTWFDLTLDDLARLEAEGESIVGAWRREAITLAGPTLDVVLRSASPSRPALDSPAVPSAN